MSQLTQKTSKERKDAPMARGLLDYFPKACAAVAELSRIGNEKHNPGQPMHWAREKSSDHADCILRHLVDRGTIDPDTGLLHDVAVAWRAFAMLELAIEQQARIKEAMTEAEPALQAQGATERRVGLKTRRNPDITIEDMIAGLNKRNGGYAERLGLRDRRRQISNSRF